MITKLTIPREKWNHGRGGEPPESALYLPEDQTLCFTGFMCEALGITRYDMAHVGTPSALITSSTNPDSDVAKQLNGLVAWDTEAYQSFHRWRPSRLANDLIDANDSIGMPDDEREAELIKLCADAGIEVEFTGKCTTDHEHWQARREED